MKKNFLAYAATCIAVLASLHIGYSQKTSPVIVYNTKEVPPANPRSTNAALSGVSVDAVNSKAVKDFRKSFAGASGEKWFVIPSGFTTKFTQNDIQYRVDYNKKGNWTGTMKSYDEKKLSRDIRRIVKSTYYDYSITWVNEITVTDYFPLSVYFIHIEDETSFKNLQIVDGEMIVLEAYDK